MFMKLIRSDTVELEYVSVKWLIRWSMTPLHQFKVKLLAWSTTESPRADGLPPYTSLKQACPYKQRRELGFEELECISLVKKAQNLFFNDSNLQEVYEQHYEKIQMLCFIFARYTVWCDYQTVMCF